MQFVYRTVSHSIAARARAASAYFTRDCAHLIDPYPAGAGRIWRHAQSPLLAMNLMAADVTMSTDDSVVCDGPSVSARIGW